MELTLYVSIKVVMPVVFTAAAPEAAAPTDTPTESGQTDQTEEGK